MSRPARRRFTILDAMVMAAATAVGLAYLRAVLPAGWWWNPGISPPRRTLAITFGTISCLSTPWMIAILYLRLRRPRAQLRRLTRQPGVMACCAALAAMIPALIHVALYATFRESYSWSKWTIDAAWICAHELSGGSVAGAWLALALSGRWRAEPDWIDRFGGLLGVLSIAEMVIWRTWAWVVIAGHLMS